MARFLWQMRRGTGAQSPPVFGTRPPMAHIPKLAALFALASVTAYMQPVHAVNSNVKAACKSDYLKHCSEHAVGSEGLRQCMRNIGEDLSGTCLVALVKAGEVTAKEIEAYKAKQAKGGTEKAKAEVKTAEAKAGEAKPKGKVVPPAPTPKPAAKTDKADAAPETANETTKPSSRSMARVKAEKAAKTAKSEKIAKAEIAAETATPSAEKSPAETAPESTAETPDRTARQATAPDKAETSPDASRRMSTRPNSERHARSISIRAARVAGWTSAAPARGTKPAYTHNLCRVTTLSGEVETFTCGLDQRCCYGDLFNEKYCLPRSETCF